MKGAPSFEYRGPLRPELDAPGERRSERVVPAHPNGIQLAEDRFLVLVSTLAFRGVDDARSVGYQVRSGGYDGPVLREGLLSRSVDDWDPAGDGQRYVRQTGHPVAFGVPKGAVVGGRPAPHANVFAAKWRLCPRVLHPGGHLLWGTQPAGLLERFSQVRWVQFRLNEANDDLEILADERQLRQRGCEAGPDFCAREGAGFMNQSYVQPVPFNAERTEWVDVCHFGWGDLHDQGASRLAALKYRWNPSTGLYAWVETGPWIQAGLFEGNISRWKDDWVLAGRPVKQGPIGWARVHDPFAETPEMRFPAAPQVRAPLTVYRCPDGALRLFSTDARSSRYRKPRNPLCCWEVDPERGFSAGEPIEAFDAIEALGLPGDLDSGPFVDMAKLLPHAGGRRQCLLFRVRTCALDTNDPADGFRPFREGEFAATGIHAASLPHSGDWPGEWAFGGAGS
jgi:hypothetical protein